MAAVARSDAPGFTADPQKQVLVLMYHQVTDTPIGTTAGEGHFGPAVSPHQFDADLSYLAQLGFEPADPLAAMQYLTGASDGNALPTHPYILTFDDGFESAWTKATPILQAHHAKAMMFVEGARTDTTEGRLTSDQIRAMARSGTWLIESHGFAGHSVLRIGPNPGDLSPYWYANLAWLPDAHRMETRAEYEARVSADLEHSKKFLEALTAQPVTAFAYPSGEYGQSIAVPPDADPATIGADAGHSNASGLTPFFFDALRNAGFTSAFAVVVPGTETAASPAFDPLTLPRIGGSPQVYSPNVQILADGQLRLPVVSPDYHWLDCKAVFATTGDTVVVASSTLPFIYALDDGSGRVVEVQEVDPLMEGRLGQPTLVAGLVVRPHGTLVAYEQKGWWPQGQPRLVSFHLGDGLVFGVQTVGLPAAANWLVGIADAGGRLVGLTDSGQVLSLDDPGARQLFALPNDTPAWKVNGVGRYAGLAYARGRLYLVDREEGKLLSVDPTSGDIVGQSQLPQGSDIRALGGDDRYLWLVNYAQDRRTLIRLRYQ
ncbi:MAG TPA: polysaccharide deacetylase family protein [Candidatus Acidoferrales bacterium]|nr:polysaccharide deacetylase family protein [Candidatus Acidoferrales bacterium]